MATAKRKLSNRELEAECALLRQQGRASNVSILGRTAIHTIGLCVIVFLLKDTLAAIAQHLAGQTTDVKFDLPFLASGSVADALPWLVAAVSIAYGIANSKLRKLNIKRFESHIRKLETMIDPGRTSSGLLSDGSTRPEDK